eukprot:TRINITY_DN11430_c0_g2_i2.p3 TRINITY_DN11430_c0_g2~~TRINITY_DN11430_c0_g2_i2.p3  ORF type:complete len:198 (+),score=10.39 TRINITY_DN11430_c0_g2_i2:162-755(+)
MHRQLSAFNGGRYRCRLMLILGIALVLVSLVHITAHPLSKKQDEVSVPRAWLQRHPLSQTNNITCRNTRIGPKFVADERGYTCSMAETSPNGCCRDSSRRQYDCRSCAASHCCQEYHLCVACCLHPEHITLRSLVYRNLTRWQKQALARVNDEFEYCLVKCRTSSQSVRHENKFRNNIYKHCFGTELPPMHDDMLKR